MSISKLVRSSLVVAGIVTAALPAAAFSSTNKARVLYAGDSIAANTVGMVTFWLNATGKAEVVGHPGSIFPGTAICDFLVGQPGGPITVKLKQAVQTLKPHLVILQFWGNSEFYPCMQGAPFNSEAYFQRYFTDALAAPVQIAEGAAAAGIARPKILWVLQGPDHPVFRDRPRRLNDIYTWAAAVNGDRTTDAGRDVSPADDRYRLDDFLPCTAWEFGPGLCTHPPLTQIHLPTDIHFCLNPTAFLHFCDVPSPGVDRYATKIVSDASVWLGI
jgi:hypothetical protein